MQPVKQEVDAQVRKVEDGVHTIIEYPTNLENKRRRNTVETVKSINPGTEGLSLLQRKVQTATALGDECAAWETRSIDTQVRKGEHDVHSTIVEYSTILEKSGVE
jgi:hypothetical protein